MIPASFSRTSPENPVPSKASTRRSARPSSASRSSGAMNRTSRLRSISRLVAGSPSYSLLRSQNRDIDAGAVQLAGDDEAVAAVVTAARPTTSARPGAYTFQGDTGHRGPGTFHEHAAWDAELLRPLRLRGTSPRAV